MPSAGRRTALLPLLAALLLLVAGCGQLGGDSADGRKRVVIWTQQTGTVELSAQRTIIERIEKKRPDLDLVLVRRPAGAPGDNSKLIAAVRGDVAPDLMVTGRFDMAQMAEIGLLRPLAPFRKRDEGKGLEDAVSPHLESSVQESTYDGRVYGIPFNTDVRGLYYNKDVLRESGVDMDLFDPDNGPMTIDQMMTSARKVDRKDADGHYRRLGVIPWDGEGSPTTWGFIHGAGFFSNETCRLDPHQPGLERTFEDLAKWRDRMDYGEVDLFKATYQPPNAPPNQTPFATGRLGMTISGNWDMQSLPVNAPKIDWGVTYLPVAEEGDKPTTWSGGFGMVIPQGTEDPDTAWEVARLYTDTAAQKILGEETSQMPTRRSVVESAAVRKKQGLFAEMTDFTRTRQPIPAAATLWDAMTAAKEGVLVDRQPVDEALDTVGRRVNSQLDRFCPFTVPEG